MQGLGSMKQVVPAIGRGALICGAVGGTVCLTMVGIMLVVLYRESIRADRQLTDRRVVRLPKDGGQYVNSEPSQERSSDVTVANDNNLITHEEPDEKEERSSDVMEANDTNPIAHEEPDEKEERSSDVMEANDNKLIAHEEPDEKEERSSDVTGANDNKTIAHEEPDEKEGQEPPWSVLDRLAFQRVFEFLDTKSKAQLLVVDKTSRDKVQYAQIMDINKQNLPFKNALPQLKTADALVNWIEQHPYKGKLGYADLKGFERDFNGNHLQRLLKACPNLHTLSIRGCTKVTGNPLVALKNTPNLQNLDIYECGKIGRESLENLEFTKSLKILNIGGTQLNKRALENLCFTRNLRYLNVCRCRYLENDFLKHLSNTPGLRHLEIAFTDPAEDSLKHLQKTAKLESLGITGCRTLGHDALGNLFYTSKLKRLDAQAFNDRTSDFLQYLKYTPDLEELNIDSGSREFKSADLEHLQLTPNLKRLHLHGYPLTIDRLRDLEKLKELSHLNLGYTGLTDEMLQATVTAVPKLTHLNIGMNDELTLRSLSCLKELRQLSSLSIFYCKLIPAGSLHEQFPEVMIDESYDPSVGALWRRLPAVHPFRSE